jgi:hypothetical protein
MEAKKLKVVDFANVEKICGAGPDTEVEEVD